MSILSMKCFIFRETFRHTKKKRTMLPFGLSWGALWAKGRRTMPFAYVL